MTTAKHEVFIGLQHENYLVGVMKLWWESLLVFAFPRGRGGKEQIFGSRRGTPLMFPNRGNLARLQEEQLKNHIFMAKSL